MLVMGEVVLFGCVFDFGDLVCIVVEPESEAEAEAEPGVKGVVNGIRTPTIVVIARTELLSVRWSISFSFVLVVIHPS